jgi:ribose 1,5-bisphosphokinase PhnN
MHVDEKDDVTWTCEAFGIPDVRYEWLKNGKALVANSSKMAIEDRDRYEIRDNVLIIRSVSILIKQTMEMTALDTYAA